MFRPLVLALLFAGSAHAALCTGGQAEMSVEGVNGIFCVNGPKICIANVSDGNCPPAQAGLPNGSYCGKVASGVFGCKTNTTPAPTIPAPTTPAPTAAPTPAPTAAPTTAPTWTPAPTSAPTSAPVASSKCLTSGYEMSVEGVPGIFCVASGPICLANNSAGTCPGPQTGLPNGSYCGKVASGVYGCKPTGNGSSTTPAPTSAATSAPVTSSPATSAPGTPAPVPAINNGKCASGTFEMSVEGVAGVFCIPGPVCLANNASGTCPGPQAGLPNGAFCGKVASGVFGCKPNGSTPASGTSAPVATPEPTFASQEIPDDEEPTSAPVTTPVPTTKTPTPVPTDGSQCKYGEYEMSVEGVRGVFCLATGPICMAENGTGTCPGPQFGLSNGAYCGRVASGVFGCKPYGAGSATSAPSPAQTLAPRPAQTTTAPAPVATSAPVAGGKCGAGVYEMSVEGVPGIFCLATGPICLANNGAGTCPGPQSGLPNGSYCGKVASGVFGCKPYGAGATTSAPVTPVPVTSAPVTSTPVTPAPTMVAPVTPTPAPTPAPTVPLTIQPGQVCGNGTTPMSIEGVAPIFCVKEPACVQFRSNGNCPGPMPGLPQGSYCGLITKTGVYGCKPTGATLRKL